MKRFAGLFTFSVALLLLVSTTQLPGSQFYPLGGLISAPVVSIGNALSSDGTTVVGWATTSIAEPLQIERSEAFRWTVADGMTFLRPAPTAEFTQGVATAVSADGQTIVGTHFNSECLYDHEHGEAYRWSASDGMVGLGYLSSPAPDGYDRSQATAISPNGDTIYGTSTTTTEVTQLYNSPFKWTNSNGLVPFTVQATAVSGNGNTLVGARPLPGGIEAFCWSEQFGIVDLGFLDGEVRFSEARAASADGSVIVGESYVSHIGYLPFRWTAGSGMQPIPLMDDADFAWASAVSTDGALVFGSRYVGPAFFVPSYNAAFVWDGVHGMRDLQHVLSDEAGLGNALAGWQLSTITGISADGLSIAGNGVNPAGNTEAWYVRLDIPLNTPEPSSVAILVCAFTAALAQFRGWHRLSAGCAMPSNIAWPVECRCGGAVRGKIHWPLARAHRQSAVASG
jgi:hypothetical protein